MSNSRNHLPTENKKPQPIYVKRRNNITLTTSSQILFTIRSESIPQKEKNAPTSLDTSSLTMLANLALTPTAEQVISANGLNKTLPPSRLTKRAPDRLLRK